MTFNEALKVLELEDEIAAREMLKHQYRWLVKTYHPDNKETGDPEEFKRIVEAYQVIRNAWRC